MDVQHAEEIMTKVMILNTYCIHSLWLIFSFVIEVPFSLSILGPINHQPETYDALVKERELSQDPLQENVRVTTTIYDYKCVVVN